MNMHLLSWWLKLIFIALNFRHYVGIPVSHPQSAEISNSSDYAGYPQQDELRRYRPFLMASLRGSRSLDTVNFALWGNQYSNKNEACDAVQRLVTEVQKNTSNISGGCTTKYNCDYNRNRFPQTLIAIECNGICETTSYEFPTRGTCIGRQRYVNILTFVPDEVTTTRTENIEGSGSDDSLSINDEQGEWIFQTISINQSCVCLAK